MIITKDVLRRAEALKAKAFKEIIQKEEPELFRAINESLEAKVPSMIESIRNSNQSRSSQMLIDFIKEEIGRAFMAETISRDIQESHTNPAVAALIKKSYEDVATALEKAAPVVHDEADDPDVVEGALREIDNEKDRQK